MSRKNLSRTVIEGGRYYSNARDRGQSSRDERATTREWLERVRVDHEVAEGSAPERRRKVYKQFRDKLGPAKRWLAAQVGRPWDKVYAELCATFDTRTIAGAHVVHSHMLDWVWRGDRSRVFWRDHWFVVDRHGILREGRYYRASVRKARKVFEAFAQGRHAVLTYRGWWWYRCEPDGDWCSDRNCKRTHAFFAYVKYHATKLVPVAALTRGEQRRLERLDRVFYNELVITVDRATGLPHRTAGSLPCSAPTRRNRT